MIRMIIRVILKVDYAECLIDVVFSVSFERNLFNLLVSGVTKFFNHKIAGMLISR